MTTWILLRGLARESAHWGAFLDRLRQAQPGAQVHVIDLPGNGVHHAMRSPWSVRALAEHCRQERERLGGREPVHLLAMSLGAMVAVDWASRAPGEVAGCVLVNTSMRPFSPMQQRLRPRVWPAVVRLMRPGTPAREIESTVLRLTSRSGADRSRLLDDWLAIRARRPVTRSNVIRQLVAAARFSAPQQRPDVPLLILASRQDGLVDSRCSAEIARRWGCPIAWHPHAGHDMPLDDPEWVIDAALRWSGQGAAKTP